MTNNELVEWAQSKAAALRDRAKGPLDGLERADAVHSWVADVLEFLRSHAGGTEFEGAAKRIFDGPMSFSAGEALVHVANVLDEWVAYAQQGLAGALPFEAQVRVEAATDLMEQVQTLLDDANVHPAAPVVLAGAALEEYLRSMYVNCTVPLVGKVGIGAYATALQKDSQLTKQDAKDITAWAGLRNAAAHGEFDQVDLARARIMVDGINLFMRQKAATA